MCLTIDHDLTKKMKKDDQQVYTYYKVLCCMKPKWLSSAYHLSSPYQDFAIKSYGIIKPKEQYQKDGGEIHEGALHLYTSRPPALLLKGHISNQLIRRAFVFEIITRKKDIIAYGISNDVAVTQYEITKEEWDKAKHSLKDSACASL